MREFLQHYFYLLDTEARKKLISLQITFIVSSLLDVIGIGLIGIFLALVINPAEFLHHFPFSNYLLQSMGKNSIIIGAGVLIISSFLFKTLVSCFIQKKITSFSYGYGLKLKIRMMKAYQYAPYIYHLKQNSAFLINHIQQVDTYTSGVLVPSLMLTSNVIIASAISILLLFTHPVPTILLSIIFGIIIWVNNHILKEKVLELGKIISFSRGEVIKNVQHGLSGLKEIRILGREDYFLGHVENVSANYAKALGVSSLFLTLPRYIIESSLAIFVILLCMGSLALGMEPENIISFIGIFAAAGARLLPTMSQLTGGISQLRFCGETIKKLYQELHELDNHKQRAICASSRKQPFTDIVLENISFKYPQGKKAALTNVNLAIKKGQSVGLIGTSGAGKSTLVDILLGFLPPQQGKILVDGQPLTNIREWVNNFAYIPQHIFLLDDSLKNNIALGVEENAIDQVQLKKAIQMAQLEQVVKDLPDGVDTLLGENGIRLSGGQRQRVALARTFYHDREIIVMDEATSALDNETEFEIINSIKRLHGIKTLIVIAHRLSTIEHCDVICKLEHGSIIKVGSFQDVVGLSMVSA